MYKKILSLLTAAAVGLTPMSAFCSSDALSEMNELGIMTGYGDGDLHAADKLTRAQAITMIMRANGFDDAKWYKSEISKFADLPLSHWASGYVYKAAADGTINGVSESEYAPEANVTYEQAVKMIVGALRLGDGEMEYPGDYLKKAEEIGMLKDVNANVGDEITREQFAQLLCNVLDYEMEETTLRKLIEDDLEDGSDDGYYDYIGYGAEMFELTADAVPAPGLALEGSASDMAVGRSASAASGGGSSKAMSAGSTGSSSAASYETAGIVPEYADDGGIIIDDGYDRYDYDEQIGAGQLTAGRWSDFKNIDFWNKLMQNQEYSQMQKKWEIPIDVDRVSPDPDESEDVLDLMFMIDTTGSMGDELAYIKEELKDVVIRLDTHVRVSCNYYRDFGDQYVVRSFPFSTNIDKVVRQISKQYASGGGDWEEAVDEALLNAVKEHDWSESARSKLLFLVLDAPPHFEQDVIANIQEAVDLAVEQGIHIVPVASSGIDKETEFFLRSLALATGGTYIFLTDDSGIGYSHIEPTVGDYEVQLLNELILDVIKEYIGQDYDVQIDDDEDENDPPQGDGDRDNDGTDIDDQDEDNGEEQHGDEDAGGEDDNGGEDEADDGSKDDDGSEADNGGEDEADDGSEVDAGEE